MGVEVEVGDGVLVGVAVGVSVGIGVNVGVGVLVGTGVGVGVAVDVGTGVNVGVGVSVGSGEGVSVAVGAGDGGVSDSSGAVKTKGVNCRSGGLSGSFPGDQQPAAPADSSTETLHHTICARYRLNTAVARSCPLPFQQIYRVLPLITLLKLNAPILTRLPIALMPELSMVTLAQSSLARPACTFSCPP